MESEEEEEKEGRGKKKGVLRKTPIKQKQNTGLYIKRKEQGCRDNVTETMDSDLFPHFSYIHLDVSKLGGKLQQNSSVIQKIAHI